MSAPSFDLTNAVSELRAAKAAKAANLAAGSALAALASLARASDANTATSDKALAGLAGLADLAVGRAPSVVSPGLARFTERFHELSGFAISDGATQAEADGLALVRIAAELRAKSPPAPNASGACAHCGSGGELRPHLAAAGGHVWLHASCWPAYDTARAEQALAQARRLLDEARAAGLTDAKAAP